MAAVELHGTRPRLYKIRRLVKDGSNGESHFEFYNGSWVRDIIDAETYMSYEQAHKLCESFKASKTRPDNVIYHTVIPVGGD